MSQQDNYMAMWFDTGGTAIRRDWDSARGLYGSFNQHFHKIQHTNTHEAHIRHFVFANTLTCLHIYANLYRQRLLTIIQLFVLLTILGGWGWGVNWETDVSTRCIAVTGRDKWHRPLSLPDRPDTRSRHRTSDSEISRNRCCSLGQVFPGASVANETTLAGLAVAKTMQSVRLLRDSYC